jgi:hypothetical protein
MLIPLVPRMQTPQIQSCMYLSLLYYHRSGGATIAILTSTIMEFDNQPRIN